MKFRVSLVLLLLLAVGVSCSESRGGAAMGDAADSLSFVIANNRVGKIVKGDRVKNLYKEYGDNHVKVLINSDADSLPQHNRRYYTYAPDGELLFVAIAPTDGEDADLLEHIIIKSSRFSTEQGVDITSTVEQITQTYPDATLLQHGNKLYIYIPTVDLYFGIATPDVAGYNSDFLANIPIDSVRRDATPLGMSSSWYSEVGGAKSLQYWQSVWRKVSSWLILSLPVMLARILFVYLLLQFGLWLVNHVHNLIIGRALKDKEIDYEEASKRVNTMVGIVRGMLSIVAWVTIVLILLSTLNINIGPIIASAGIVGLAVGFGAQELVRDYISGFFILFENQLRAGDIAIIDGKEGFVEKIELRTISLRDVSGVVHIFQNGKINSLSNMTKERSAIMLDIGVSYNEDVDRVMEVMMREGRLLRESEEFGPLMIADMDMLGLDRFDDSAIVFKLILHARPRMQWRVKREYQRRLKIAFDREGIEIPFPQVTINYPKKQSTDE